MGRLALVVLFCLGAVTGGAKAQNPEIRPVHVPAGTVLTFYLQTRLNPAGGNALDLLPKGTVLNIKVMDTIDSGVTNDGAEFRGLIVAPLLSGNEVVVRADAEVRGVFALLRSRNHPDGFRYELLITSITDGDKSFRLTASLNPSFLDPVSQPASSPKQAIAPGAAVTGNNGNSGSASSMHK
jgi:hypothetical protein